MGGGSNRARMIIAIMGGGLTFTRISSSFSQINLKMGRKGGLFFLPPLGGAQKYEDKTFHRVI